MSSSSLLCAERHLCLGLWSVYQQGSHSSVLLLPISWSSTFAMLPIPAHCRLSSVDLQIYQEKLLAVQCTNLKECKKSPVVALSIFQVSNITEVVVFWTAASKGSHSCVILKVQDKINYLQIKTCNQVSCACQWEGGAASKMWKHCRSFPSKGAFPSNKLKA